MRISKRAIKRVLRSRKHLNDLLKFVQKWHRRVYYRRMYKKVPTQENLVLFEAFLGKQYACSPRAIYEAMRASHEFDGYQFVWVFRRADPMRKRLGDGRTTVVKYNTRRYYRAYARAKYWVTNWRLPDCLIKKDDQICIQTWHGTPFKKIGRDLTIEGNATTSQRKGHRLYLNDAKRYDYFVSPSKFCTNVFASAFGLDVLNKKDILIETGYPRNDRLRTFTQEERCELREQLHIPSGKKVILYAPTWRDNQYTQGVGYSFALDREVAYFLRHVPEDWVVLLRMHYLVASSLDLSEFGSRVINVSSYEDINDLYIVSDTLVTDYSSVFFDYANLSRPILFFMYDLDEYEKDVRDFYFGLDRLPGPVLRTGVELEEAIAGLDSVVEKYRQKYEQFTSDFCYLDDGAAGYRVATRCILDQRN